jgi:8-oxo-dGTP pyrophosphatase MutT (NUDIX family)
VRLAGRVIAIDPAGRVLLFRYEDPPPKGTHWATPGGGVEGAEDFYQAACRELVEETGWTDVPVGPAEVHQNVFVQWSGYFQSLVSQHDHYFIGRVADESRPLGEVAAMHVSDGIHEAAGGRWPSSTRPTRTFTRRVWPTWSGPSWRSEPRAPAPRPVRRRTCWR